MTRRTATSCTRPPSPTASTRRASRAFASASRSRRLRAEHGLRRLKFYTARVATPTAWATLRPEPSLAAEEAEHADQLARGAGQLALTAPDRRARAGAARPAASLTEHAEYVPASGPTRSWTCRCTRCAARGGELTSANAVTISMLSWITSRRWRWPRSSPVLLLSSPASRPAPAARRAHHGWRAAAARRALPREHEDAEQHRDRGRIGFSSCTRRWRGPSMGTPGPRRRCTASPSSSSRWRGTFFFAFHTACTFTRGKAYVAGDATQQCLAFNQRNPASFAALLHPLAM